MANTATPVRVEPSIDPAPPSRASDELRAAVEVPTPPVARSESELSASSPARSALDQLSRIEDKSARIEEKYARTEALLLRVEDKLGDAASRMSDAARQADLDALRQEVAAFSRRFRNLPSLTSLVVVAIVTALLTSAITVALLKYGLPGVLAQ
jgi:hypothetical protein